MASRIGWSRALILLLLSGIVPSPSRAGQVSLVAEVRLRRGPIRVRVACAPAIEGSGRRIREAVRQALPVLEELIGVDLEQDRLEVRVHADPGPIGGDEHRFDPVGRSLAVHARTPDWLVAAGLAGLWWNDSSLARPDGAEAWALAGLSRWLAVEALRLVPRLGDAARIHTSLIEEGWDRAPRGFDPPLSTWNPPLRAAVTPGVSDLAWSGKAYGLFRALSNLAGSETVTILQKRLLGRGQTAVTQEILAHIRELVPEGASGWVIEDAKPAHPPYPAGRGIVVGLPLPPLNAPRVGIVGSEQNGIEAASDLLEIGARADPVWLTFDLKVRGDFADPGPTWCLGIDVDQDGRFDSILGFRSQGPPWVGEVYGSLEASDFKIWDRALITRSGSRAVVSLPVGALGLQGGPARISAYTLNGPPVQKRDSLGWIRIEIPVP